QNRGYRLDTANALWLQEGEPFLPDFLALLKKHYGAEPRNVDFNDLEGARRTINAWAEKQTRGRVKELIPPNVFDDRTLLVLTNAVYFKGEWAKRFPKDRTENGPFWLKPGAEVAVPLMHLEGAFPYTEGEGYQIVDIPYVGKKLSLVVLLPRDADG